MIEDRNWILAHLNRLTDEHEASFPRPWKVSDAPAEFIEQMMNGIVGLEIPIRRLEGKWKMSQNRTAAERDGVLAGLGMLGTPEALAVRDLVANALKG